MSRKCWQRIPERFTVLRHVRPKFSCGRCQKIIQAPAAKRPFPNAMAGAPVIANVLVSKFCDHTPLYRQNQIYARSGVSPRKPRRWGSFSLPSSRSATGRSAIGATITTRPNEHCARWHWEEIMCGC
jgi:hypothetical protein